MIKSLRATVAALALAFIGLSAHMPAAAGVVFTFNNSLTCATFCSIATDSDLAANSAGYAAVPGFDSSFVRGTSVTATVTGLGAHNVVSIDFLLAVIDSWDGLSGGFGPDIFSVSVDGTEVFAAGYDQFNPADQSPVRGTLLASGSNLAFSSWNDSAYDMASVAALHDIAHSASTLTVNFLFANSQGLADESFGLENIRFSTDTKLSVPEPSSLALLGLALVGAGLARRRRG